MPLSNLSNLIERSNQQPDWRLVSYTNSSPDERVASMPAEMQFPYMATSMRDGPAEWVDNRDRYVEQYTGSAYIAIGAIAKMAAMQKVKVQRRIKKKSGIQFETVKPSHPLVELFETVNPVDTPWDLWFHTIGWGLITGNAYIYKARNGFNTPVQLWPMPSQWVHAVPDPVQYISGYKINSKYGFDFTIPADYMIDIKQPSLDWSDTGRYYGQPAIKAASTTLDLENEMLKRLWYQFKNFTPPGMVFETDQRLQPNQVQQLWAQFAAQHSMSAQTGRPMVLHSGMKLSGSWQPSSNKEMAYSESLDKTLEMTMATLGVPAAVVGLTEGINRSNAEAALLSFCKMTVNPLLEQLSQHLTQDLATDFAPDRSLVIQVGPCEVDEREYIRKAIETLIRAGAVTPDETRHLLLELDSLGTSHGSNPVMISGFQQTGAQSEPGSGSPEDQATEVSNKAQGGQNQYDMATQES